MPELLDYSWAKDFIYKYEEEHDLVVEPSNIEAVLRKVMYEKDFYCDKETLEELVEQLIEERM
jgi:uncharacterized protein YfaA (DUF2138 family)